jgi:hypothetical protein
VAGTGGDAGAPHRPRRGSRGCRVGGVVGCRGAGRRRPGNRSGPWGRLRSRGEVSAPRDTMQACRPTPWNPLPACVW